jgi:predicted aspartyl protease
MKEIRIGRREFIAGFSTSAIVSFNVPASAAEPPLSIPVSLEQDRLVLKARINEQGPFRFVLDTGGAMSLIDRTVARSLHLMPTGQTRLSLAGRRAQEVYHDVALTVDGAFRQPHVALTETDLIHFGSDIQGSLSAGFLTAVPGAIAFDTERWVVWPDRLPDLPGYIRVPKSISVPRQGYSPWLFAPASIEGKPLRLVLDTGFPGAVRLTPGAARRVGIFNDGRPWAPGGHGRRSVRVKQVQIAGISFENIIATHTEAAATDVPGSDGLVGLSLLRAMNIAADPATRDLWLRRNTLSPSRDHYSLAGIWLDRTSRGGRVSPVGLGSPGEKAGLAAGDELIGNFEDLVRELGGPAGAERSFEVRHGGATRTVLVTLTPYL